MLSDRSRHTFLLVARVVARLEEAKVSIRDFRVRSCLNREALTVRSDATLAEVQALFARYGVEAAPVLGRDENGAMRRLEGMVTRHDLLRALLTAPTGGPCAPGPARLRSLAARREQAVLAIVRRVRPLGLDDSLADAVDRLVEQGESSLPVVDPSGRVMGTIGLSDVVEHADGERLRSGHPQFQGSFGTFAVP